MFAGFGDVELFPSLHAFEIDGMVCGRLKYSETKKVDIDRAGTTSAVVPFAQRDVTESFLYGVDLRFEAATVGFFRDTARTIAESILDEAIKRGGKRKADLRARVDAAVAQAVEKYWDDISPKQRDEMFSEINDMVRSMPKQDLAQFAEALVNITSVKRKISAGAETVGGPIDVAIISRHEGFIWVKRKYYFDLALNPRFFWRKFGSIRGPAREKRA